MKTSHVLGLILATAAILAGVYVTNIGQEMAVRIGGLSPEDLRRIPSLAVFAEARGATSASDPKKVMGTFHMILNAQLGLLLAAGIGCGVVLIAGRKNA